MAKRTDGKFERRESDYYPTPASAVQPLLKHLNPSEKFCEPCAGNGMLAFELEDQGFNMGNWSDLEPRDQNRYARIPALDIMDLTEVHVANSEVFITNTPWPRPRAKGEPTLGMIHHMVQLRPVWMLLAADFCHNVYWKEVSQHCVKIVSVGRVSWMMNGIGGFENAAWYLFDANHTEGYAEFHGRT